jgi:hypothetical protein
MEEYYLKLLYQRPTDHTVDQNAFMQIVFISPKHAGQIVFISPKHAANCLY